MGKGKGENSEFAGHTHIGLVIDRSGSMRQTNPHATRDLMKWLRGVKGAPGTDRTDMRVIYFDDQFDFVSRRPLAEYAELAVDPRGATALYDATAQMIRKLDKTDDKRDRTLLVAITDGQENASRETEWEALKEMMALRTATGRWTFVFLAAELTSVSSANMTRGAGAGNVSARGIGYMGDQGVVATRSYLGGDQASVSNFTQEAPPSVPDEDEDAKTVSTSDSTAP
jgi:hypothetical protein